MRFTRSAMSDTEAGARYGAPLNVLAAAIAADAGRQAPVPQVGLAMVTPDATALGW